MLAHGLDLSSRDFTGVTLVKAPKAWIILVGFPEKKKIKSRESFC
jgi:hypothetical protein